MRGQSMLPSDFSKKPIAAGLLVALYGATALAQDAAVDADEVTSSEDLEEVLVTGIRYSIKRSMDLKRSDEGVMDAITAKDMGAFPDTNLAESLQRITGVSIERERGEGKYVTVRGFGPAFNLVLLNGRQMPTTGGDSRSFDFSNLASEGIRLYRYSKVVKQMCRQAVLARHSISQPLALSKILV